MGIIDSVDCTSRPVFGSQTVGVLFSLQSLRTAKEPVILRSGFRARTYLFAPIVIGIVKKPPVLSKAITFS